MEALKALSVFFNENTLRTRRNLRSHVERRSLATNEQFEEQFRNVKEVESLLNIIDNGHASVAIYFISTSNFLQF